MEKLNLTALEIGFSRLDKMFKEHEEVRGCGKE